MPEPEALYEIKDGIAYITMNRPEKLNAIDPPMRQLLWEAFQDVKTNPEVRCAIVTGRGRAFSTGHDLVAMANDQANEGVTTGDLYVEQSKIYKPIISAINGICLAQGCGIALGSDIRIASTEARFGWPQAKRGISSVSGPALLSQVVPRNIAFEFLFTGDFVDAQRALDLMLVNYVVPPEEVVPRAEEMARMITANAPLSLAAIKEASIKGRKWAWRNGWPLPSKSGTRYWIRKTRKRVCGRSRKSARRSGRAAKLPTSSRKEPGARFRRAPFACPRFFHGGDNSQPAD